MKTRGIVLRVDGEKVWLRDRRDAYNFEAGMYVAFVPSESGTPRRRSFVGAVNFAEGWLRFTDKPDSAQRVIPFLRKAAEVGDRLVESGEVGS